MSLVDYPSSDDEEEENKDLKSLKGKPDIAIVHGPQQKLRKFSSKTQQSNTISLEPSVVKLPDASMLLNSLDSRSYDSYPLSYSDHNTWVEAAVTRNASGFGSSSSSMYGKVPKTIPDTIRGQLVPPQLKGRSNVVTEDIGKLFVRNKVESKMMKSVFDE